MTRLTDSTAPILRVFLVLTLATFAGQLSAQAPPADEHLPLFAERGAAGELTTVAERGGRFEVSRQDGPRLVWSHELPTQPDFLQAGSPAGTVAVGRLRNDGGPRWAKVITADGETWSPPGEVRLIHLSKQGDKVLTQVRVEGAPATLVFDPRGNQLARFPIPHGAAHVAQFTARGDAVAVSPGPDDSFSILEVHEIGTGRSQRHEFDEAFAIQDSAPLDADHVVVLGSGTLTMVLFPGAEEFAAEGPLGWSLGGDGRGYSTLLGTTADGERLLATRGFGRFDVVSRRGEILWSFDPQDAELLQRIPGVDLRQLQPFLRADGAVLLTDREGGSYLLTWPASRASALGAPRISRAPATPRDS